MARTRKMSARNVPAKGSAKRRVAEAERIYNTPDREEVVEANNDLRDKQAPRKPDDTEDVVLDVNVRKPI